MKGLLFIAMSLVSISAFAAHHEKPAHTEAQKSAMEACMKEHKDHKADQAKMDACMAEKMKAAGMDHAPKEKK